MTLPQQRSGPLAARVRATERILVPLDGSSLAESALVVAEVLARASRSELVLVRALPPGPTADADVDAEREAEAYLVRLAQEAKGRGLDARWHLWYQDTARAIVGAAEATGVGLVVMGTHGRSGLDRLRFGSIAEAVAGRAPVPVLLVRGTPPWGPDGPGRVVVPLDGSERSEDVLPVVERLAGPLRCAVDLLQVLDTFPPGGPPDASAPLGDLHALRERDALGYLEKIATGLGAKRLQVNPVVREGTPVETIVAHVRESGAELIAMSTHGRTGLARVLVGSVAAQVLRATATPVLLWKAPAAPPRPES